MPAMVFLKWFDFIGDKVTLRVVCFGERNLQGKGTLKFVKPHEKERLSSFSSLLFTLILVSLGMFVVCQRIQ
jgi:hypothetical protein